VQITKQPKRITILQSFIHLLGWTPLAWMFYRFFSNTLSVNPIQELELTFGDAAIYFLVASLACTPILIITGWQEPLKHRQALGLYSFLYASLHVITFLGLDYGFNFRMVAEIVTRKPYALVGFMIYLILLVLAFTSLNFWKKKLKKSWTTLQRLVYVAALLGVLHFAWARKGNIFTLSGDLLEPILLSILVMILLIVRIPFLRQRITALRRNSSPG
jgi:sulfoxide reductase heme-binding subunit YedZ